MVGLATAVSAAASFSQLRPDIVRFIGLPLADAILFLGFATSGLLTESGVPNKEAIAGEDGVGPALKFLVPKVRFAWWRRPRKPRDHIRHVSPAEKGLDCALNNYSYWDVYKGVLADGSPVTVKRLAELIPEMESQYQSEIKMFSLAVHRNMAVHRNLIRLLGFCMTPAERLLVYPYMANGSLASQLRARAPSEPPPPLDWPTRKRIALEIARGLSYLHENCLPEIIHCDVNAANILLDENFVAHLGDIGFTKLIDRNLVTIRGRGTFRHIAPEYLTTETCSQKTDVFAYGITLLELINGKRGFNLAWVETEDVNDVVLLDWVEGLLLAKMFEEFVDPELEGNYIEAEVESVLRLALLCSQNSPVDRPKMSEVVRMVEAEELVEITERWEEFKKLFDERRREREWTYHELWRSEHRRERELAYQEARRSDSTDECLWERELTYDELWGHDSTDHLASIELSSPR